MSIDVFSTSATFAARVNDLRTILAKRATGFTIGPDFRQVPTYQTILVQAQIQALTAGEIQHLFEMNIQGVLRAAYLPGDFNAIVRVQGKGGDLFIIDGQTWLAAYVFETWSTWSKIALVLQTDQPVPV
jgi:hypothetical protein